MKPLEISIIVAIALVVLIPIVIRIINKARGKETPKGCCDSCQNCQKCNCVNQPNKMVETKGQGQ